MTTPKEGSEAGEVVINNPNLPKDFEPTDEMLAVPVIRFFLENYQGPQKISTLTRGEHDYLRGRDSSEDVTIWWDEMVGVERKMEDYFTVTITFFDSAVAQMNDIDTGDYGSEYSAREIDFQINGMNLTSDSEEINTLALFIPEEKRDKFFDLISEHERIVGEVVLAKDAVGRVQELVGLSQGVGISPEIKKFLQDQVSEIKRDLMKVLS